MITAIITLPNGEHLTFQATQVQFERRCRYHRCRIKFLTIEVGRVHCCDSHKVMACRYRKMRARQIPS